MSADGKSSGYISMVNLMPFLPSDWSANAQKHENVVNERADKRTDERVAGSYSYFPSTWCRTKLWSEMNIQKCKNKNKNKQVQTEKKSKN